MFNYSTSMYFNTSKSYFEYNLINTNVFIKINLLSDINLTFKISYLVPLLLLLLTNIILISIRKIFILFFHNTLKSLNFIQSTDLIPLVIMYIMFIIVSGIYSIITVNVFQIQLLLFMFIIYGIIIIALPLTYFMIFGINTLVCLGLTQKKTYLSMFLNDCIVLTSFLLRICSQYIRLGLITVTFLLLFEYINSISVWFNINPYINQNFKLFEIIIALIRVLFELIDFFFIFILQINVFFVVLIWLLSFLFIVKFKNIFEL